MHRSRLASWPTVSPRRPAARARPCGVTLIEMLVTLAVAALVVGLGAPSFLRVLARHAIANQAQELQDAVRIGRAEAMHRSAPVLLCRTEAADAGHCASGGGSWQTWLLFADVDRSGNFSAGDSLLRDHSEASRRLTVTSDAASIRFESTGIAHSDAGNTTIVLSPADGDRAQRRQVCVNTRGEVVVVAGDAVCP
jgi:type IV fimbrial biogenesis protein FimT